MLPLDLKLNQFHHEPGHGAKGKQWWLASLNDLSDMYSVHAGKK